MNKQLIRDLAVTGGIYDCITDPYDKLNNGDPYSSVMPDLERFAEKIVRECINKIEIHEIPVGNSAAGEMACEWTYAALKEIRDEIREHFGVGL